jgi:hypothetical protein
MVGAIAVSSLVSVAEHAAMGATFHHTANPVLLESATMGAVGGVLRAGFGMLVVVAAPWIPHLAPVVEGLTGLLAGPCPVLTAEGLEPVETLRAGR